MSEFLEKLNRMIMEPKVYALLVKSTRGQVLHMGVHFSLEEAYAAARVRMQTLAPHQVGEAMDIDLWNCMTVRECLIQFFDPNKVIPDPATISADPPNPMTPKIIIGSGPMPPEVFQALLDAVGGSRTRGTPPVSDAEAQTAPTIQDHVTEVKEAKNDLLQKLVETGDSSEVDKLGRVLTSYERKYVLKKIADKVPVIITPKEIIK